MHKHQIASCQDRPRSEPGIVPRRSKQIRHRQNSKSTEQAVFRKQQKNKLKNYGKSYKEHKERRRDKDSQKKLSNSKLTKKDGSTWTKIHKEGRLTRLR